MAKFDREIPGETMIKLLNNVVWLTLLIYIIVAIIYRRLQNGWKMSEMWS